MFSTHHNGIIVTLALRWIKTTLCTIIIIIIMHSSVLMGSLEVFHELISLN